MTETLDSRIVLQKGMFILREGTFIKGGRK